MTCFNLVQRTIKIAILSSALLGSVGVAHAKTQLLCILKSPNKKVPTAYVTRSSKCKRGYVASVVGDARAGLSGLVGATGPAGAKGDKGERGLPGPKATTEEVAAIVDERLLTSPVYFASYEVNEVRQIETTMIDRWNSTSNVIRVAGTVRLNKLGKWETRITAGGCDTGFVENAFDSKATTQCHNFGTTKGSTKSAAWFIAPAGGSQFPILRVMYSYGTAPQCAQVSVDKQDSIDFLNFIGYRPQMSGAVTQPCPFSAEGDMTLE